jgi:hypothetical protein
VVLQESVEDSWVWVPGPNSSHSVGGANHLLTHSVFMECLLIMILFGTKLFR